MDTHDGVIKKRDLAPMLKASIQFLISLSNDIHFLEVHDSDRTSKRVKMGIMRFRTEGELHKLEMEIKKIRDIVNRPKSRKKKEKINN
jgi:hypothetical protein